MLRYINMNRSKKKLVEARFKCQQAKVGEEITCPSCGTKHIKTSYQSVFCKTKGGTKCKDNYWNNVDPSKRCNTTRISPASAAWLMSEERNLKMFGMTSPSVVGGSGKISGITSEGYRIMDGIAYDEFDAPVYSVSEGDDNEHPFSGEGMGQWL